MFKIGDLVQLRDGGALLTVSELFKSPEGREMAQCTWLNKRGKQSAAFVISSLESAEEAKARIHMAY